MSKSSDRYDTLYGLLHTYGKVEIALTADLAATITFEDRHLGTPVTYTGCNLNAALDEAAHHTVQGPYEE